jgi:hypothetical protein
MFYPNALFAVHKLTFLPARLVARENLPSPQAFSFYEKMGGGGVKWIGPNKPWNKFFRSSIPNGFLSADTLSGNSIQ